MSPSAHSSDALRVRAEFEARSPLSRSIFCILAYTVVALLVYAYASYHVANESGPLIERCEQLQDALAKTTGAVKRLSEVVSSLSDPTADEYALITELRRDIPEGTCKILYPNPQPPKNQDCRVSRLSSVALILLTGFSALCASSETAFFFLFLPRASMPGVGVTSAIGGWSPPS